MGAREKVSLFVVLNLVSFFCISGLQSEKTCLASEKQLPTESVYAGDEVLAIKGTVSVRAICGNTWSDGENYFYQYNVFIVNNSGKDVFDWDVEMTFLEQTMADQNQNGSVSISGKTVSIIPEEYNKKIMAGNQIRDIGVIVRSVNPLCSVELTIK